MRLLSVNMTLDPASGGGSAARTIQVTQVLTARGVACAIATADEGTDRVQGQVPGVPIVRLPVVGGRFRVPMGGFASLRDAVEACDIVLLLNHWTAINVLAWRAALRFTKPYVVCPAGALPVEGGRSRALKHLYNACAGRAIIAGAGGLIAVTAQEAPQFEPYGVDRSAVTVIPNGMPDVPAGDATAFRTRHALGTGPILLFMGRLAPIKGPDLLLAAFARCAAARPDWQLVMAGPDDGMLGMLRAQVVGHGLDRRVHFPGFLDDRVKPDALAAASLVVVPSRREAMSIVVLEAASASRAVLVTDQCGIPDVAASGGGWVVEANAEALAEGVMTATADPSGLQARGAVWREAATGRYSRDAIGQQYVDLFASVLRGRGR